MNRLYVVLIAMLFSGKNNSILLTREYYQDYSCEFDLHYYPFDTQVCNCMSGYTCKLSILHGAKSFSLLLLQMCTMIFEIQDKTEDYVKLERDGPTGIEFLGARDCTIIALDLSLCLNL